MTSLAFRIVNVFTRGGGMLTGNPLCVFENGEGLDTATMQALARQFNLSETTFILPSRTAAARVRIFTPNYEMPFAGHPTLGTAFVCHSLGLGGNSLELEMQAGSIPVTAQGKRWTLQANAPTWRSVEADTATIAAALSLKEQDLAGRPLWVKAGKEQLIVPLTTPEAVRKVVPQLESFASVRSEEGHSTAYVFAPLGEKRMLGRFFFMSGTSVIEDPATGSATANLGGWLLATSHAQPATYEISQGEQADRPSTLYLDVDAGRIFVGGEVLELGRGTLEL